LAELVDGKPAQAFKSFAKLSNGQPPPVRLRVVYHQGIALIKMGQYARAAELLEEVVKDPNKSSIELPVEGGLALAYALNEQWDNALNVLGIKNS
jgi:hypothetical protein